MDVKIYNSEKSKFVGEPGELVCLQSFPSMPICFWQDENDARYLAAYFEFFPDVWRHGDWVEITEHGGLIMYGRSDATLNPGGVRIGTDVASFRDGSAPLVRPLGWCHEAVE